MVVYRDGPGVCEEGVHGVQPVAQVALHVVDLPPQVARAIRSRRNRSCRQQTPCDGRSGSAPHVLGRGRGGGGGSSPCGSAWSTSRSAAARSPGGAEREAANGQLPGCWQRRGGVDLYGAGLAYPGLVVAVDVSAHGQLRLVFFRVQQRLDLLHGSSAGGTTVRAQRSEHSRRGAGQHRTAGGRAGRGGRGLATQGLLVHGEALTWSASPMASLPRRMVPEIVSRTNPR